MKFKGLTLFIVGFSLLFFEASGNEGIRKDTRVREYITPKRIVWLSDSTETYIINPESLLKAGNGQADLINHKLCELRNTNGKISSILLDYGKEMHGGLEIVTGRWKGNKPLKVRIRFGESVSEAMSEMNDESTARNDHAIRDHEVLLPWLGKKEIGNTGFRFVRIDLLESESVLFVKELNAISIYRDIEYKGSFECSDTLLNKIWMTGAYTVHLNMQNFLWDGIKRDRLVWVGDMHPEVMTINSVFGYNEVVPKSLDLIRDNTPLPQWMNGISSYSMWWVMIHHAWFLNNGDEAYLKEQNDYLMALLNQFCSLIDENGQEHLTGHKFLDWPSSPYPKAVGAGYNALLKMTLQAGADMCEVLGETETTALCLSKIKDLKKVEPNAHGSKQAASLLALAELLPVKEAHNIVAKDGAKNFSTFYGYYMLESMAKANDYANAMEIIKTYWGGMLKLGATTFWEDFNIDWLENAGRIDELPRANVVDVHAEYGDYCYVGLRHSFCHGWASGPTAWLSSHVLGVQVMEPGCKVIKVEPHLGNLTWVKGTYPTPFGVLKIEHRLDENGKIQSTIDAPKEIRIIKQ